MDAAASSGSDLDVAGITSPRSSLSPLGGFPSPHQPQEASTRSYLGDALVCLGQKQTSAGTGSLKHVVLSVELLASLEGVVRLPAPTSHALATCPLGPWPDPQLHTGVTGAPHELSWLPEATMQGTANPGPGWPSDKDHPRSLSLPLGAQPQQDGPLVSSGRLSVPPWTACPVPCLTLVSQSWSRESHRKINHRALNPCLRLCFWGGT